MDFVADNERLVLFGENVLENASWEKARSGRLVRLVELYRAGNVRAGLWEGEPGASPIEGHPYDEYCTITAGELVVTDEVGRNRVFRPGDSFAIPKGFVGTWDVRERVRKTYFISE